MLGSQRSAGRGRYPRHPLPGTLFREPKVWFKLHET
jgi:hypothetical protein